MTAIVWFTRDLRLHDHPALQAAVSAHERVVPLFVLDEAILHSSYHRPNRARFLLDCLRDLDEQLRRRGAALVIRRGDPVREVTLLARQVDAAEVHASADVSDYAQQRAGHIADALARERRRLCLHPGITVVPAGQCTPAGRDHAAVFTPYFHKWIAAPKRRSLGAPRRVELPSALESETVPKLDDFCEGATAPYLPAGGESAGRQRLDRWLHRGIDSYEENNDDLAGDATSRLSPYLHFGCLSANEIVDRAGDSAGAEAFVRQLAWRDFHHQLLAARPGCATDDYRGHRDRWRSDPQALAAWREGRTGFPVVDAGMRQLLREGWMHNRARLITASFLVKDLYIDWRAGARHFLDHLVDGDIANNQMNWQWVAGTGADTRPNRMFNPTRQAERFDPDGDYVRRYVPELAGLPGATVHQPWSLPEEVRRTLKYPAPLIDHAEAVRRFRDARASG